MTNQEINHLKNKVSLVARNFLKAKKLLYSCPTLTESNTRMFINYIKAVQQAYEKLSEKEKRCLNNEYFFDDKPEWWKPYINENEFEQLHNQTVIHFMEGFYASIS